MPMPLSGIRGRIYALFGVILLATLWVTSLSALSDRRNATDLLTEAGAHVLNPFLVDRGLGLSQATYATLESQAKAHPSQLLTFQVLKANVTGQNIIGHNYSDVVQIVYQHVAKAYYDGGPEAAFAIPPDLQQILPDFGLFNLNNVPVIPGGPTVTQLPPFLQPLFTFVGLTPATFTATEHQRLLGLLPWFWLATAVLGVGAVVLNPSERKLAGLAQGVLHSAWPIVGVLVALLVASSIDKATFAPYAGLLGVVSRVFLPVYGTAFAIGLVGVGLTSLLPALLRRQQGKPPTPIAPAGIPPAGVALGRGSDAMQGLPWFGEPQRPPNSEPPP